MPKDKLKPSQRKLRAFLAAHAEITIKVSEDDTAVRGNAMASGDDAQDKACEDEIIDRLERGDVWAWCVVRVRASYKGLSVDEYLGACSYPDERAFRADAYFDDLRAEALEGLAKRIEENAAIYREAIRT